MDKKYFNKLIFNYRFSKQHEKNVFNSEIWKKINSEKNFHKLNLNKIVNFKNNGLSRGFDNDYLRLNSTEHKKKFLDFLKKSNLSFDNIKKILPKKNIGNNPTAVKYKNIYLDGKTVDFVKKFVLMEKYVFNQSNINSCLEIGAGHGEFARMIIKNKGVKYILIDLPETNLLSSYYLNSYFPKKKIILTTDLLNGELTKSLFDNNQIFIICPWDKLGDFKIHVFLNFHSFMEMNLKARKNYFTLIQSKINNNGFFFIENNYCKLVNFQKNLLRDYEYDNKWKTTFYAKNPDNKKMGIIITQRSVSNLNDIKVLKKQIKIDGKESEVPKYIPVFTILIYKFMKRLFTSK